MDAMAIESGKQAIYLQNIYRVYHGLGTAAYSSDLAELAYVISIHFIISYTFKIGVTINNSRTCCKITT